jgi:hypothetical protein
LLLRCVTLMPTAPATPRSRTNRALPTMRPHYSSSRRASDTHIQHIQHALQQRHTVNSVKAPPTTMRSD